MKKLLLAITLIASSMGYVLFQKENQEQSEENALTFSGAATSSPVLNQEVTLDTNAKSTGSAGTSVSTTKSSSPYKDGTFTGSAAQEPYGTVQVAVVVSGGKITQVKILQQPRGERETNSINSQALPMLVSETISAQSANVDSISGASLTSPAYLETLQNALSKASA